jgi:uncharacterized membrane protein YfcA
VSEAPALSGARKAFAWMLWLASSTLGTICGIGGGIFATPIQHYVCGVPLPRAISTSLVLVLVMTLVATGVEATRADGAIDWSVVGLLLVGSIPGAQLGYAVGKRASLRALKLAFVVLMVAAAIRLATLSGRGATGELASGLVLSAPEVALVIAVGFGGGFLAPLLGVGGGILVIPMLFLLLSDTSYLEVRACSMAMSIVNAAQSVWLNFRDGRIDFRAAAPYAAIAVVGALAGAWLVHLPGWGEVARIALTVVLLFVAVRFALDVRSTRA